MFRTVNRRRRYNTEFEALGTEDGDIFFQPHTGLTFEAKWFWYAHESEVLTLRCTTSSLRYHLGDYQHCFEALGMQREAK